MQDVNFILKRFRIVHMVIYQEWLTPKHDAVYEDICLDRFLDNLL